MCERLLNLTDATKNTGNDAVSTFPLPSSPCHRVTTHLDVNGRAIKNDRPRLIAPDGISYISRTFIHEVISLELPLHKHLVSELLYSFSLIIPCLVLKRAVRKKKDTLKNHLGMSMNIIKSHFFWIRVLRRAKNSSCSFLSLILLQLLLRSNCVKKKKTECHLRWKN